MATCARCQQPIPAYDGNIGNGGWVQPTPPRARRDEPHKAEKAFVDFKQGSTGMTATALLDEAPVCADCYLVLYAEANTGAELPVMPKRIG
jgi:hypothetical protein